MTDRTIDHWLAEHGDDLIAARRHLHAHPELSNEEFATTAFVAERLETAGLSVRLFSSGTGLLSDLGDASAGRGRLGLRADIDAFGMVDEKDVPYRSQVAGACHACGHDVHTTILLATALFFAQHPEELPGPIRCIFQPAEERVPGGAKDVLADGGIDGVDAMFGLHCWPKFDVGTVGLRAGSITSAADMVTIELTGPGGHTARPEETVDLLAVTAQVIAELPTQIDEFVGDPEMVKFVFGSVHGGDAANVIPTRCELKASIRTPSLAVWEMLPAIVEKAIQVVVDGTGAAVTVDYVHGGVPPVVNDAALIEMARRVATTEFGSSAVLPADQSWGGDDFAWYSREIAAAYIRLGVHDPRSDVRHDLHVGRFDVDEDSIAVGTRLTVGLVQEYFASAASAASTT